MARRLVPVLAYTGMLAGAVGLFLLLDRVGRTLSAPPPAVGEAPFGSAVVTGSHAVRDVLVALLVIILTGRLLGLALRRLGQPLVIGEVFAGILLGPSLLGRVWPEAQAFVLPASLVPGLGVVSQLGVVLYMFVVGLGLDTRALHARGRAAVAISHASIVAPFTLGAALALLLYPRFSTSDVPFTVFALFVGVSLSVTAFPVLARILRDRGIERTALGATALACAAADDVTAWCLLAFVVSLAAATPAAAAVTIGLAAGYAAFMLLVARPWIERRAATLTEVTTPVVGAAFLGLLASALATEVIGVHALFGAFLFGAILPSGGPLASELARRIEDLVTMLLLPAFFAFTGLRTRIDLLDGAGAWGACALVVLVATVGKVGGTAIAARVSGLGWREAAALGALMNTRGLMELIVLNVGLDLGILSPGLFAIFVVMALVTTFATAPMLRLVMRREAAPQPVDAHSATA